MKGGLLFGALAALALVSFHLVGNAFLDGFSLDLGSTAFPAPRYIALVAFWMPCGALASVLLATAIAIRAGASPLARRLEAEWEAVSDTRFVLWTSLAAFAIPLVIRYFVLDGVRLTDDESIYRFMAELLASGRLWAPSPESKIFFDQNYMINDGRMYGMYFVGWPALLAPATVIGGVGFVNPLLSALTVPALFGVIARIAGPSWARGGVFVFLSAPFLQVAAATLLSHTACLMALTWCLFLYFRATADDSRPWHHSAFALAASLAVFIRPQSALPLVAPLIVAWFIGVMRGRRGWVQPAGAFAVPAAVMAGLFLAVLAAQNGSPFRPGYVRYVEYLAENNYRFSGFSRADAIGVSGFDFSQVGLSIARTSAAMFRLNVDLFGWPSSFVFLLFACSVRRRGTLLVWTIAASYLLFLLFQENWGIDTFGPPHAFELALPIIVLSMIGARSIGEHLSWRGDATDSANRLLRAFAPALLVSMIVTAWLGFIPYRFAALQQIAARIKVADTAPERQGISRAVVFAPSPFVPQRCGGIPSHYVFFRPTNDPDLKNGVLWVNHLDLEQDRRLAARFADRPAYLMEWTKTCETTLVPLDAVASSGRDAERVVR